MNNHDEIRDLLTLAAAGALDAGDQRRVEEHLRECADCSAEFRSWQQLTGALEKLPTPQAPAGLVERTQRHLERQAAARAEHRRQRTVLLWLAALTWGITLLTWPLFQVGGSLAESLGISISSAGIARAWIGYNIAAWMITAVVAVLLGQKFLQLWRYEEGRTV